MVAQVNLTHPTTNDIRDIMSQQQIVESYVCAYRSRQMSLIGRQEVLNGRAKFGIFGDGKEIAQVALAHVFQQGDFRSGYYRDQTIMLALNEISVETFFAQLYAHPDLEVEPASGGRMMNAHFATRSLNADGTWRNLVDQYNTAADMSPTAAQMPRLVGLAYASRLYRELPELQEFEQFSRNGNEIAFGTIGNASTAEGLFWESINAIGVLRSPAIVSIWDDGYGISVTNEHQMLKGNISEILSGFQRHDNGDGFDIYTVPGWDFPALVATYREAAQNARTHHIPAIVHVTDLTQPQGHSTSGSHERYKTEDRLQWETEKDALYIMRQWMIAEGIVRTDKLDQIEEIERDTVRDQQRAAWRAFTNSIKADQDQAKHIMLKIAESSSHHKNIRSIISKMEAARLPKRKDILEGVFNVLKLTSSEQLADRNELIRWRDRNTHQFQKLYSTHLTASNPLTVAVPPSYPQSPKLVNGFELLNRYFDATFARDPRIIAFGEDVGQLGGVNQTMLGLQARYGELRVSDTGIREATILGQAIGMALRGLRPIAEIQYLDYILYALQIMSDDLASLRWRTHSGQAAPVIVRTRGHRLEGIWHSGSPMGGIIHFLRGIHVLVPRDMTRAAGFYNTLLDGDDPGLVIEALNGYRKKEALPENLTDLRTPLGVPEILRAGSDITLVTYGSMCHIAIAAADELSDLDVEVEVIDVQSLLPFDVNHQIVESLKRTNRLIVVDEDVPGGASSFIMQQILEVQDGYRWLDSKPLTITAQAHRPAYGTDGDFFSKPNRLDIVYMAYDMMNESDPYAYPPIFQHPPTLS